MATITKGRTFVSGEVVTPSKLNTLVDGATISGIVNADIDPAAAISGSKIADASIPTAKLADGAATTPKIADGAATTPKIADGAITPAKLNSTVILVPTGAVMPFAMNSAPTGWLSADGSAVSRTTYATLFSAIGTTYGAGDGSTTFGLPDLRGYFVRGSGTNSDATASGAFGAKQADELKSHTHTYGGLISAAGLAAGSSWATSSLTSGATGGTETRPRNIAMLYCIKF